MAGTCCTVSKLETTIPFAASFPESLVVGFSTVGLLVASAVLSSEITVSSLDANSLSSNNAPDIITYSCSIIRFLFPLVRAYSHEQFGKMFTLACPATKVRVILETAGIQGIQFL